MDQFTDWADIPNSQDILKNEELDQYLEGYNEDIDELFNQTLIGIQDLDVPTGFVNDLSNNNQTHFQHASNLTNQINHGASSSTSNHSAKHSRKISGTAIFGFENHTRELSIELASDKLNDKSISPVQLLKTIQQNNSNNNTSPLQKLTGIQEDNDDSPIKKKNDYIVTNTNPKAYKFPPSPSPSHKAMAPPTPTKHSRVSYSAKYLQELGRLNNGAKSPIYADDIEPLLNEDKLQPTSYQLKYVPIPVNEPLQNKSPDQSPQRIQQIQQVEQMQQVQQIQQMQQIQIQQQQQQQIRQQVAQQQSQLPQKQSHTQQIISLSGQIQDNFNTYLPPPTPPTLSHGSPEQSSPEPQSYGTSSPQHLTSSPTHQDEHLFYNPQFFSDDNNFFQTEYSSPSKSVNSSPIKNNYYSSPLRSVPINQDYDETVDADNTIPQMTPLKPTQPITPSRNKVILEWSPIVSPNAKSNKDVKQAIRQSSAKKRIKKTSLLPPGELDKYWEGPDENKFFICTYKDCGKKFTRRYNVRSHIQTHLSDRPFSCAYCPKKFVRQHDLNRHIKGHLEARPCRCPCGKEFARVDAMKKHKLRNICSGGIDNGEEFNQQRQQHQQTNNEFSQPIMQNAPIQNYNYLSPVKYGNPLTSNILDEVDQIGSF